MNRFSLPAKGSYAWAPGTYGKEQQHRLSSYAWAPGTYGKEQQHRLSSVIHKHNFLVFIHSSSLHDKDN